MIFGVSINNRGATYLPEYGAGGMLTLAKTCEELGFNNVWVHDNITGNSGYEAMATLAAVSALTQTIKIGTSILMPFYRNPILLSQQVSTIDHLSGGRLILGLGTGGVVKDTKKERAEFTGSAKLDPFVALEEYITALKALWVGGKGSSPVSFDGRYVRFRDVTLTYSAFQNPYPPIWIAAGTYHNGRYFGRFDLVAKVADGWFTLRATPQEVKDALDQIVELRKRHHREAVPFTSCVEFWFCVDPDRERALNVCRDAICRYIGKQVGDDTVSRWSLFGPASEIIDRIDSYGRAGVDSIKIVSAAGDQIKSANIFAKEIMPSF